MPLPDSVPLVLASLAAWRAVNDPASTRALPDAVLDAVVKLSVRTIEDARTGQTLGTEREGTGIVIGADGVPGEDGRAGTLILTIGYLVIEARSVSRLGDSDLGVNARRLQTLERALRGG